MRERDGGPSRSKTPILGGPIWVQEWSTASNSSKQSQKSRVSLQEHQRLKEAGKQTQQRPSTPIGGNGLEVEHEHAEVSRRRKDDALWIIPNIRRGLVFGRRRPIRFPHYSEAGGSGGVTQGQLNGIPENEITDGGPLTAGKNSAAEPKEEVPSENKPNTKHNNMYRLFEKPLGQQAGEKSRDYPRINSLESDEKRYAHLKSPKESAYDPLEIKLGRILMLPSSD